MRRHLPLILGLLALLTLPLRAADSPKEIDAEVRKLLELTGSANLGTMVAKNMIAAMKPSMPNVPDEFWAEFEQEIKPNELTELVVPIYAKTFTLAELRAANAFYSSPEGRSMVQKLPSTMTESMQVGQKWGQELAARAIERLKAKGLIPKDS